MTKFKDTTLNKKKKLEILEFVQNSWQKEEMAVEFRSEKQLALPTN